MREKLMILVVLFLWMVPVYAQQPEKMIPQQPDSVPYTPAVNYAAGSHPISVFCANLNGDIYLDLAVADFGDSSVTILMNNGNGTYDFSGNYPVGIYPRSVFCADFDQDGDLDLATANNGSYNVSVMMNYGNGTFSPPENYMVGINPTSLFCVDLDGDDDIDIAVTNGGSNNVTILRNQGNGIFSDTVYYLNVGASPVSIFGADMDGDGDMDLAVADQGCDSISILMNYGNGYFQSAVNYVAGYGPSSIFCADLDNDSDMDVAVVNQYGNTVRIFGNAGNGSLSSMGTYDVGDEPRSIFCTDVNGDGYFDLAVTHGNNDNILLMENFGQATFENSGFYGVGSLPMSVFAEDVDRDGDFDLVTANYSSNTVSVLKNLTQIDANQPPSYFSLFTPYGNEYWQDTTTGVVFFDWQNAVDPNLGDQVRYNLYVSTSIEFLPLYTTVYHNLFSSHYVDVLPFGQYYWKVMAHDNWGASQWSNQFYQFFNYNYIPDTLGTTAYSPVDLIVNDPNNDSIGLGFNTIPGAAYDTTQDINHDGDKDDLVILPNRLVGLYMIRVFPEPAKELSTTYSLGIRIDGGAELMLCHDHPVPGELEVDTFYYYAPWFLSGDANGDWNVDVGDVVYLINYLYKNGPPPDPVESGDATCEGAVEVGDVVFLINFLFKGGPPPAC